MLPEPPIRIDRVSNGVEFDVKVTPNSSRSRLVGVWNLALRVTVAAPPEGGKANREVERLLAETLAVKRAAVAIVRGQTSSLKRVRVVQGSVAAIATALTRALSPAPE